MTLTTEGRLSGVDPDLWNLNLREFGEFFFFLRKMTQNYINKISKIQPWLIERTIKMNDLETLLT